jgi:hypothetical protein
MKYIFYENKTRYLYRDDRKFAAAAETEVVAKVKSLKAMAIGPTDAAQPSGDAESCAAAGKLVVVAAIEQQWERFR